MRAFIICLGILVVITVLILIVAAGKTAWYATLGGKSERLTRLAMRAVKRGDRAARSKRMGTAEMYYNIAAENMRQAKELENK